MEKDRNARIIAIVALVLAVAGVSIGFAVLSTNLTIEAPEASVKANNDLFTVYFSSNPSSYIYGEVQPELSEEVADFTGNEITVASNSTKLTGIGGTFTKPGQTITYHLGVSNQSKLTAYLHGIYIANNGYAICTPVEDSGNPIDASELDEICHDIHITIRTKKASGSYTSTDCSTSNIKNVFLEPGETKEVDVTIGYKGDATPATGDFKATFGDIKFGFTTESNEEDEYE